MPLRFTASEKQLKPDARYGSKLVSKFVNCLMWDGKKTVATRVFYDAMDEIHRKMGDKISPLEVFEQALDHVKPAVEIQSKRVGGATYQVPVRVEPKRQIALAMRWIIQASRGRKGRPMHLKLAEEFMAAFRREGEAVTKRENVHKMADANKAFAHFAH
jgi:small subunit ribosomal protein S7